MDISQEVGQLLSSRPTYEKAKVNCTWNVSYWKWNTLLEGQHLRSIAVRQTPFNSAVGAGVPKIGMDQRSKKDLGPNSSYISPHDYCYLKSKMPIVVFHTVQVHTTQTLMMFYSKSLTLRLRNTPSSKPILFVLKEVQLSARHSTAAWFTWRQ